MEYFGELSIFEIVVSISGLIGGGFAVYSIFRSWLRPARVELRVADTVDLVLGSDGIISAFHLACSFENHGAKTGTIQRMDAIVRGPDNESCNFRWASFYEYRSGGMQREKLRDRHAIAVRPNDTEFAFVIFDKQPNGCETFVWLEGEYEFEILAWVNAKSPMMAPKTRRRFRAVVTERLASQVGQPREQPIYWAIEISDWAVVS